MQQSCVFSTMSVSGSETPYFFCSLRGQSQTMLLFFEEMKLSLFLWLWSIMNRAISTCEGSLDLTVGFKSSWGLCHLL